MAQRPRIALLAASIVAVVLGVVWYLEPIFGGLRMDQLGIPRVGAVPPSPVFLILKLGLALLAAVALVRILARGPVTDWKQGAQMGALVGLVGATLAFDSAQAGQPLGLVLTDGAFMILVGSVMGASLARAVHQEAG